MAEAYEEILTKPSPDAVVEVVYVTTFPNNLPEYVEVLFYVPGQEPVTERLTLPQDGRRWGAYVKQSTVTEVVLQLNPF